MTALATAPYAVWMAFMLALPAGAGMYAARTAAVAAVFLVLLFRARGRLPRPGVPSRATLSAGVFAGLAVFALWVLPEKSEFYRRFFIIGGAAPVTPSPFDPAVCGWPLALARLFGSSFVIAPAEELFFRHFLYRRLQSPDWQGVPCKRFDLSSFLWTSALFALEHDRVAAGFAAGAVYLFVYMRRGLAAAVLAHCVTNFVLALYVLRFGLWGFW